MKKILLIALVAGLSACSEPEPVTRIVFAETDNSTEPYMSRTIITPTHLRMDYNDDEDDYILFDRKTRTIYSVIHGQKNIVVVKPQAITVASPIELKVEVVKGTLDESAPEIDGKPLEYYQYKVNDQVCFNTISVQKLLPFANKVHKEYMKTLAGEHARILSSIPADQHNACDLAANIYHVEMKFGQGFPINEWHGNYNQGYKRQMVDYELNYKVAPELMTLPEGYRQYQPSDMMGGG